MRIALYADPQPQVGGEGCGHATSEEPVAHLGRSLHLIRGVGSPLNWYLYHGFEVSSTVFKQTVITAHKT